MGHGLLSHIGRNYPSQLGLYHTLQTKIFRLNQGGNRVTVTSISPKTCNPEIPATKKQMQKDNFYIHYFHWLNTSKGSIKLYLLSE